MKLRPSLLMLTALAAGVSALTNAINAAAPVPAEPVPETRLGVSIKEDMAARDQAAARRARALEMREQAAKAAEARLAGQGGGAAPTSRRAAPEPVDPAEERYAELARIYQAMKPKAAAPVFEQLAMDVQVEVAERMRERATAAIMAAMTPKGAAALTMAIARREGAPAGMPATPQVAAR